MSWIIPSAAWRDEILLIRELYNLNMPQAKALLDQYGSAEVVFETYQPSEVQCEP